MADYSQMVQLVADYYGAGSDQWLKIVGGKSATADELLTILKQTPGVNVITAQDGSYRGWTLANTGSINVGNGIGAAADSNIIGGTNSLGNTGNTLMPPKMAADSSTGLITITNSPKTLSGKLLANGGVAPAIAAVATGLSLGIAIDKAIYAAKPGFLSDEQLENFNPDNWKQISNVVDEQWTEMGYPTIGKIGRKVFDTILGIDSTDNSTQMYIDEDAYAYMAWYLQQQGAFSSTVNYPTYTADTKLSTVTTSDISLAIDAIASFGQPLFNKSKFYDMFNHFNLSRNGIYDFEYFTGGSSFDGMQVYHIVKISKRDILNKPILYDPGKQSTYSYSNSYYYIKLASAESYTVYECIIYKNGKEEMSTAGGRRSSFCLTPKHTLNMYATTDPSFSDHANATNIGDITEDSLAGVESQPDAVLPSLSNATDIESVKTLLKQQYPDVWTNSVTKQVLQPDGTLKTFTYVPVPTPNATDWMDTEPTGDGSQQNQKDTIVNPDMDSSIKDAISSSGSTGSDTPNPPDTGDGNSPTIVPPVGKASSLWSIYNPTLEQVNQFGSWLWSSNFVEQLKKLFSDPMQAIIGLHKVYSPVQTSGQGTIKCGYLDSGVPSKLVSEQYITVDCGSVDLQEYFGNVFDYPPYTEVSIYLPFIGIRQLDPSDVMRSTISVKYRIDVLTGACLAEVNVQRDAAGGTLYTFSGDAAVRYPVSSGSYMGIVSGLIGVATSVVSGNLLPALGGVTRLHTNVERSGSFTGNSGAMGSKVPYLIISRPQTAMADKFETLSGYPSNTYTLLSDCKGFTQVKYCHVENLSATETEKKEIERLLKEGVIL